MHASRSTRTRALALGAALTLIALPFTGAASASVDGQRLAPLLSTDRAEAVPGEYIVVLERGADATTVAAATGAARSNGGVVQAEFSHALLGYAAKLSPAALAAVRAADGVQFVEANLQFDFRDLAAPGPVADPDGHIQPDATWGLDRSDQRALPLDTTYRYRSTGGGVRAYVIDSGMRISHQDFQGRAVYGWDVVGDDPEAPDCFGHGTHVGGTVGSKTYGIAKEVEIVSINVCFGSGQTNAAYVIEGVDWVTEHAVRPAVTNMSLGFALGSGVAEAVEGSIATGITYVVAAGNSAGDACIIEPAAVKRAITVAASTITDQQASFSSYGKCVDLYAPGNNITSLSYASDTGTAVMSGTSMSSPHVTGAVGGLSANAPRCRPEAGGEGDEGEGDQGRPVRSRCRLAEQAALRASVVSARSGTRIGCRIVELLVRSAVRLAVGDQPGAEGVRGDHQAGGDQHDVLQHVLRLQRGCTGNRSPKNSTSGDMIPTIETPRTIRPDRSRRPVTRVIPMKHSAKPIITRATPPEKTPNVRVSTVRTASASAGLAPTSLRAPKPRKISPRLTRRRSMLYRASQSVIVPIARSTNDPAWAERTVDVVGSRVLVSWIVAIVGSCPRWLPGWAPTPQRRSTEPSRSSLDKRCCVYVRSRMPGAGTEPAPP